MKKLNVIALSAFIASTLSLTTFGENTNTSGLSSAAFNSIVNQGTPADALTEALKAQQWAIKQGKVKDTRYLTVIEFNRPSYEKRMQVIDLQNNKVLYNVLVSQGSGSGPGAVPTIFSDKFNSHSSVDGVLVTTSPFIGKHGKSLSIEGLESFNKNANARAIEFHPAKYVTDKTAGHSWGCFAIDPNLSTKIIDTIKDGSVVFAYAPQSGHDYSFS